INNTGFIVSSIFERAFVSGVKPLYYYFSLFPENHEFLLGKSFSPTILAGLLDYNSFNIENYIYNIRNPDALERGISGTNPTVFIGEVYANYGFIVMLISIIVVGFLIGWFERALESLNYTYLNVAFYISLAFIIKDISIGSIQAMV